MILAINSIEPGETLNNFTFAGAIFQICEVNSECLNAEIVAKMILTETDTLKERDNNGYSRFNLRRKRKR